MHKLGVHCTVNWFLPWAEGVLKVDAKVLFIILFLILVLPSSGKKGFLIKVIFKYFSLVVSYVMCWL
jgi:hypothetical protein